VKRSILQLIAIASVIFILGGNAPASEYYNLSLSSIKLGESERIAGFEIKIRSGRIESLPSLPMGWNMIIDNDPSWNTSIQGIAIVGAAFLDADDKDLLQKLMIVERLTEGMVAEEIPFDVKATVHVVNTKTGKERTITEGKEKLLTPLKR
jgi:hypothetical protein